jgi:hypothetical protein
VHFAHDQSGIFFCDLIVVQVFSALWAEMIVNRNFAPENTFLYYPMAVTWASFRYVNLTL